MQHPIGPRFQRAQLLYEQGRHAMAVEEVKLHLAQAPNDANAFVLLALCLTELQRFDESQQAAEQAIGLAPDASVAHYALANVLCDRRRYAEALAAIGTAIELDPDDADYRALAAQIFLNRSRWQDALNAAEEGLALDPEHAACGNLRAMALLKLGRKDLAGTTLQAALARNPENPITHAMRGWELLERRQTEEAVEHFREALRLDPTSIWARSGIVEALKSRNFAYRAMLRYFLWMAKLPPNVQWAVLLGGVFGQRALKGIADANPDLAPFVTPMIILYVAFAVMTWISRPLFNLLLRFNRVGRLALTQEQIVGSNWLGGVLAMTLVSLAAYLAGYTAAIVPAAFFGVLLLPVSAIWQVEAGRPRFMMTAYTCALAALGVVAILRLNSTLIQSYLIGGMLSTWVGSALATWTPRR